MAEMNLIGVPVPPGFTITTDVCNEYFEKGKDAVVALLKDDVAASVHHVEELMNCKFGDVANPLLVSVRSGARASMPGMMDTILNLGLNDEVVEGLAKKTGNERFAYDSYRRFVQMYGDVVLGMKPVNKEDIDPFEAIIQKVKAVRGIKLDNEMSVDELKQLVTLFKEAIKSQTGKDFPNDGTAVGCHLRRVRQLDERTRYPLPQNGRHTGRMGYGSYGNGDGIRKHGTDIRYWRMLQPRRGNGRKQLQRRIPCQRAG